MASARGIEAGKAFVRVGTDQTALEKSLKQMEARFASFGSKLSAIGKGVAGIGAIATGLGTTALGGITALAQRFASAGDVFSKTSDRTGIAASSLSEIGYAAEQSGTDIGQVEKSVKAMQRGIVEANGGNKKLQGSFESIGLSTKALAGLNPEGQFLAVAKAIGRIQDPTTRAARAMEVFGKSGTQLIPLLTSDIEALRQEARDLGVVISNEDAKNATNLGDAFDRVKKSLGGIATQLGAAVAVPFANIANSLATIIGRISAWVAANRNIVQTIAAVAAGFVVVGTIATGIGIAIVGVGATITAIGTIIGSVVASATAVFGALSAVIGAILSPIGLVVAAVVGLGAYITYTALQSTGSLTKLSEMFGGLGKIATTAWGGIVAAVSTGDLETAGQIAFTAIEVGWLTITSTMQDIWGRVSDFFVNAWLSAVESIVQAGASIYFGIAKYFDLLSVTLIGAFDTAFVYIAGAIDNIQTAIAKAIIKAQEFFGLFSQEESVQIQQTLDDDLARRAGGRQSGLDQRGDARQAGLDSRDATRRATAEQFSQIVSEDFQRRRTTTDRGGLTAAQQRLADLQASLAAKASEAQAKAAKAQEDSQAAQNATLAQNAANSFIKSEGGGSVGTFVAGVAGAIAGGGTSKLEDAALQQVDLLSSIDGRLRENNDAQAMD